MRDQAMRAHQAALDMSADRERNHSARLRLQAELQNVTTGLERAEAGAAREAATRAEASRREAEMGEQLFQAKEQSASSISMLQVRHRTRSLLTSPHFLRQTFADLAVSPHLAAPAGAIAR